MQSPVSFNCLKKLNVLEIIGTATKGGMENYLINFFKHLSPEEFCITCICPCESPFTAALREIGIQNVFITPIADNPEWRSIQLAMEVIRSCQIDVIHAHMPKSHVLAGIAGSLTHKPVVATLHGMHVTSYELGLARAFKSHLITNCQETFIQALALGIPDERVYLFHNGVDTKLFIPAKSDSNLRNKMNVPQDCYLIGFAGRLEYEKGPDLFIRAAAYVHTHYPDAHFAVVGDGSMRTELKQLCRQLQVQDHVHFIDWVTDTENVYPLFNLLVHTSRNDGTSLVILEAMSCGCPVAAMAVGGVRDIVENERTGMLVDANDWSAMGRQISDLLARPRVLQDMAQASRKRVEEKFDIQMNAYKTAGLLQSVTGSEKIKSDKNNYKLAHD